MRVKKESQLEVVEVLRVSELPGRAFAEVKTADGKTQWEELSREEARREQRKLKRYRVIKKRPRKRGTAPAISPVIRIGSEGIVGFGSNLLYKGTGLDGRPEYWHIPTATILVEEIDYASRQMAATFLMLKARSLI